MNDLSQLTCSTLTGHQEAMADAVGNTGLKDRNCRQSAAQSFSKTAQEFDYHDTENKHTFTSLMTSQKWSDLLWRILLHGLKCATTNQFNSLPNKVSY